MKADPSDLSARFFRAQLLVSMGRGEEIRDEIELLTMLRLPESEIRKARALLAKIDKKEKRLNGKVTVRVQTGYADNINSWPANGQVTRGGLNYPLPDPIYQKFDEVSDRVNEGQFLLTADYRLNDEGDLKSEFSFISKVKHAPDTVSADQRYNFGSVGLRKVFDEDVTAKFGVSLGETNRVNQHKGKDVNTDLKTTSANFDLSRKINHSLTLGYRFTVSKRNHSNLATADLSDSKTDTNRFYVGAPVGNRAYFRTSVLSLKMRSDLSKGTTSEFKKSRERVNKDTRGISVLGLILLPHDQRIVGTASYNHVKYDEQIVSGALKRKDKIGALTLGYSINGVQVWSELEGLSFGIDAQISKTASNQSSAKITSKTYMLSVAKSFDL